MQPAQLPKDNISVKERKALKDLKNDNDIIILPADKGCVTVILNKEDYYKKCDEHIKSGPYEHLSKDPTNSIKEACRKKLQTLKDRKII